MRSSQRASRHQCRCNTCASTASLKFTRVIENAIVAGEAMNTELVPGTRLVVSRRGYRHHGIYAGRGRVIHYAGRGRYPLGCIEEISLDEFRGPRPLHVGIAPHASRGREIVQRARSRLGECHYDVLSNNCEHFCSWCELAEPHSPQIEALSTPLRLLLQAAISIGPRWQRFLRRVAVVNRWVDA